MSSPSEIARPYSKAAFEVAKKHDVKQWLEVMALLNEIASSPKIKMILKNPLLTSQEQAQTFIELCDKYLNEQQKNFIKLLAENKRLAFLPEIYQFFLKLYDEYLQQEEVTITSSMPINAVMQQTISAALQKRLNKKIVLNVEVNPKLLGGALIKIGDRIIDGTLLGRLQRLANNLDVKESLCQQ